jgi:hypothetical protein
VGGLVAARARLAQISRELHVAQDWRSGYVRCSV